MGNDAGLRFEGDQESPPLNPFSGLAGTPYRHSLERRAGVLGYGDGSSKVVSPALAYGTCAGDHATSAYGLDAIDPW